MGRKNQYELEMKNFLIAPRCILYMYFIYLDFSVVASMIGTIPKKNCIPCYWERKILGIFFTIVLLRFSLLYYLL